MVWAYLLNHGISEPWCTNQKLGWHILQELVVLVHFQGQVNILVILANSHPKNYKQLLQPHYFGPETKLAKELHLSKPLLMRSRFSFSTCKPDILGWGDSSRTEWITNCPDNTNHPPIMPSSCQDSALAYIGFQLGSVKSRHWVGFFSASWWMRWQGEKELNTKGCMRNF